jgi:hypothetical protein
VAVGLGIGAVVTATAGTASANTSDDLFSFFPDPAADVGTPALNLAISYDGTTLFQEATASATSGGYNDLAIAIGNDSVAEEFSTGVGSQFSVALADGNGAEATAGVGNFDTAAAIGDGSIANAEGGNFDSAFALGAGSDVFAGGINSATNNITTEGDNDLALAIGSLDHAIAGVTSGATVSGFNEAFVVGSDSTADAGLGTSNLAGVFGDSLTATAENGQYLIDLEPGLSSLSSFLEDSVSFPRRFVRRAVTAADTGTSGPTTGHTFVTPVRQ